MGRGDTRKVRGSRDLINEGVREGAEGTKSCADASKATTPTWVPRARVSSVLALSFWNLYYSAAQLRRQIIGRIGSTSQPPLDKHEGLDLINTRLISMC